MCGMSIFCLLTPLWAPHCLLAHSHPGFLPGPYLRSLPQLVQSPLHCGIPGAPTARKGDSWKGICAPMFCQGGRGSKEVHRKCPHSWDFCHPEIFWKPDSSFSLWVCLEPLPVKLGWICALLSASAVYVPSRQSQHCLASLHLWGALLGLPGKALLRFPSTSPQNEP